VHAIFFLVSLVGYSQVLFEDGKTNRMHESISLFSDIVKNPLFKDTPVFILLNKADLFEQNIKTIDLNTCFPDYTNGPDYPAALDHVKMKYKEVSPLWCRLCFSVARSLVRYSEPSELLINLSSCISQALSLSLACLLTCCAV
jgi:hypothetical protein